MLRIGSFFCCCCGNVAWNKLEAASKHRHPHTLLLLLLFANPQTPS
jgi:hypothetical protein